MDPIGENSAIPDNLDPLERQFLAKNVLQDDNDDGHLEYDSDFSVDEEFAHLEEEELYEQLEGTTIEDDSDWSKVLTQQRPKNNTGGKGVLEDYKEAQRITKRQNETRALKQREAWKKHGYAQKDIKVKSESAAKFEKAQRDDDEEDDSDEEAFFEKFRMLRMQQLSAVASLPQFGQVKSVGKYEFVDTVDEADPRTFVVVHVYEDYLLACQRMNKILTSLAARFPHVMFLKLKATEADQTLSHSTLPAFLVYKGGKLVGRAAVDTTKTEFQNENFSEEDVEYLLAAKYKVNLPGVDVNEREQNQKSSEETVTDSRRGIVAEYS